MRSRFDSKYRKNVRREVPAASTMYSNPGTYFAVLRAASQREGDARAPYALIQSVGRVRVVVR